jgi:rubrerythrin
MYLIEGNETIEEVMTLAYGLEDASRRFYQELTERSDEPEMTRLFETLRDAEIRHEDNLWERYQALSDNPGERRKFAENVLPGVLEGGVSPDNLFASYSEAFSEYDGALDWAMAMETDALDLYLRMAAVFDDADTRAFFHNLAEEERDHLKMLGDLRGSRH